MVSPTGGPCAVPAIVNARIPRKRLPAVCAIEHMMLEGNTRLIPILRPVIDNVVNGSGVSVGGLAKQSPTFDVPWSLRRFV
jgi:hypothetical protein